MHSFAKESSRKQIKVSQMTPPSLSWQVSFVDSYSIEETVRKSKVIVNIKSHRFVVDLASKREDIPVLSVYRQRGSYRQSKEAESKSHLSDS
jgi:hypothetical protein